MELQSTEIIIILAYLIVVAVVCFVVPKLQDERERVKVTVYVNYVGVEFGGRHVCTSKPYTAQAVTCSDTY